MKFTEDKQYDPEDYIGLPKLVKKENYMKISGRFFCILLLIAALLPVTPAAAVSLGQTDDFEDGTTQGWQINLLGFGSPPAEALPKNILSGGPAGVDDNYLQLTSVGGAGAGSRLTVLNFGAQWAGDYIAAGVGAISMDVYNLGNSDLLLRLLVSDPTIGPPQNVAFSTLPVLVPAGSGWMNVIFPLTPADLTAGLGSVLTALTGATELRIFHNPDPGFPGPAVVAQLGVDNITAVPLPPTALLLLGSGLLTLAVGRQKVFK